jgi:hypothetical protein
MSSGLLLYASDSAVFVTNGVLRSSKFGHYVVCIEKTKIFAGLLGKYGDLFERSKSTIAEGFTIREVGVTRIKASNEGAWQGSLQVETAR